MKYLNDSRYCRQLLLLWLAVTVGFGSGMGAVFAEVKQTQNVVYAEVHGIGLVMDVFQPVGESNGLAIVDVVSGSWNSSRGKLRDHQLAQVFERLCGRGYTVFAVRPGSVSKFTIDEMVEHVEQAIQWIKKRHKDYQIDPLKLGIMGASAGGHLASLVAVRNGKSSTEQSARDASVHTVAVFFPPTDLMEFRGQAVDLGDAQGVAPILRQALVPAGNDVTPDELETLLRLASPARCVTPNTPPFLLIHGTADDVVPISQSEKMVQALQEVGVEVKLIRKEGGGHPWLTIYEEVEDFGDWFDQHLRQ
ncbi:MAG: prolyl oligopeptidase family serine peptidase [bacterium]|nr:prolyl oligopeptidase family serine peptidase [bacterium]